MKCFEYGKDHPQIILLLHGGGLSWWNYREAAELLRQDYHVVLPILDGHAGSDRPFTTIESNAEEIIAYREGNGRFGCIEDIMKVSGIKTALFEKIKDRITVD